MDAPRLRVETIGELTGRINARKSVGGEDLTAAQVDELIERRAVIIRRVKGRVVERINSHTTLEVDRVVRDVNAHAPVAVRQVLCPDLPPCERGRRSLRRG